MLRLTIAMVVVLVFSVMMTITGRGGGNFYVPALIACGSSMHEAATTGQCVLFLTAIVASLVFQKYRMIDAENEFPGRRL